MTTVNRKSGEGFTRRRFLANTCHECCFAFWSSAHGRSRATAPDEQDPPGFESSDLSGTYMAEELLRLEGFFHVEYVPYGEVRLPQTCDSRGASRHDYYDRTITRF